MHEATTTRSVRRKLDFERAVDPKVIEDCIDVATQAPTGLPSEPWRFLILNDAEIKWRVAEFYRDALQSLHEEHGREPKPAQKALAERLHEVPVLILVCALGRPAPDSVPRQVAFYGSVLLAGLVSARQRNDDGTDVDVIADGWRLFDPDGKGHLTRDDLARVCSQMGVAASPADVENMLLVLSPTAALAPEPARTNMLQQLLSPERRKRLVEQILMAGLNVAPDAEEAALDDAADAAASAPPAGPVVTYERYAKTVQAAFSRSVGEGEFVFRRGDPADAVYLIKSGSCEVLRHGPLPKQQTVVMTLAPGDCCGQSAVLDGRERREASVRAIISASRLRSTGCSPPPSRHPSVSRPSGACTASPGSTSGRRRPTIAAVRSGSN